MSKLESPPVGTMRRLSCTNRLWRLWHTLQQPAHGGSARGDGRGELLLSVGSARVKLRSGLNNHNITLPTSDEGDRSRWLSQPGSPSSTFLPKPEDGPEEDNRVPLLPSQRGEPERLRHGASSPSLFAGEKEKNISLPVTQLLVAVPRRRQQFVLY